MEEMAYDDLTEELEAERNKVADLEAEVERLTGALGYAYEMLDAVEDMAGKGRLAAYEALP